MRLATPEAVLAVLGIQVSTGSLNAAGVALDATFSVVESTMDTRLTQSTRIDYFDIGKYDKFDPVLRLSTGFVSKDDTITVYCTDDGLPLTGTAGSVVDPIGVDVDYERGIVSLTGLFYACRKSVSVSYTAGFAKDNSDATMLTGVPDDIVQGAISMAASYMQLNPANVPKEKAKAIGSLAVSGLEFKARQALSAYDRPRGTAIWAAYTKVED